MAYNKLVFNKNTLVRNSEMLNGKKDMRKKFIKSNRPTISIDRIQAKQNGGTIETDELATYNPVQVPQYENSNPFSIFSIPELQIQEPVEDTPTFIDKLKNNPVKPKATSIEELLKNNNIDAKITSGYRPNAITKSGHVSNHAKGQAWDIVPTNQKSFEDLRSELLSSPEIRDYFKEHGYGVLSEVSKGEQNKYGSTGAHFHIGPDSAAVRTWNNWISKGKSGMKILKGLLGIELPELVAFTPYIPPVKRTQPVLVPMDIPQVNDATYVARPTVFPIKKNPPLNVTNLPVGVRGFYNTMKPILEKVLSEQGKPDDNIVDMIAQLGGETGWGKNLRGSYNLGNIKRFHGDSDSFVSSGRRPKSTIYKNYSDLYDFAQDYVSTLSNGRYNNPFNGDFFSKVKNGGYAESKNYVDTGRAWKQTIFNHVPQGN